MSERPGQGWKANACKCSCCSAPAVGTLPSAGSRAQVALLQGVACGPSSHSSAPCPMGEGGGPHPELHSLGPTSLQGGVGQGVVLCPRHSTGLVGARSPAPGPSAALGPLHGLIACLETSSLS